MHHVVLPQYLSSYKSVRELGQIYILCNSYFKDLGELGQRSCCVSLTM